MPGDMRVAHPDRQTIPPDLPLKREEKTPRLNREFLSAKFED